LPNCPIADRSPQVAQTKRLLFHQGRSLLNAGLVTRSGKQISRVFQQQASSVALDIAVILTDNENMKSLSGRDFSSWYILILIESALNLL
jgi:hypothetical protein